MRDSTKKSPVTEEEHLLETVQRALSRSGPVRTQADYQRDLEVLRESLGEERLPEDMASIIEQMEMLKILARQTSKVVGEDIDAQNPYFGHMRLEDDDGRRREVLIGKSTWIREGIQIVDWRNAPISRIFYQCREGDAFELHVEGNEVEGEVLARRTLSIRQGQLQRVDTGKTTWIKTAEGQWVDLTEARPKMAGGSGASLRSTEGRIVRKDKHLPEIASLLDPAQFEMITRANSGLIAIQGSAGSGKTTVALHRVAFLAFQDPRRYDARNTLILVYSKALASYISAVLPALGVEGFQVQTWDGWAAPLRERAFPKLPRVFNDETPAIVSRFKQSAAVLGFLEDSVARHPGLKPLAVFNQSLTDRGWLGKCAARHSPGVYTDDQLDEIHLWCSRMHAIRDAGGGDNEDDVPTIDAEDEALLLRLWQLCRGPLPSDKGASIAYNHIVVDEAQDLSPVELAILIHTARPGSPITLAGDTAQRLDSTNDFQDWSYVLTHLGLPHTEISPLQISYRSTAEIMALALDVLGPLAPDQAPLVPRSGPAPSLFCFANAGEMTTMLFDRLEDLMLNEPDANVAILARYPRQADAIYEALARAELIRVRRVADQDFSFTPGIDVTDIVQAKGLEFDYVVVVDVDDTTFPRTSDSRHLLHVAITRAAHMCWICTTSTPSPLLPPSLKPTLF